MATGCDELGGQPGGIAGKGQLDLQPATRLFGVQVFEQGEEVGLLSRAVECAEAQAVRASRRAVGVVHDGDGNVSGHWMGLRTAAGCRTVSLGDGVEAAIASE